MTSSRKDPFKGRKPAPVDPVESLKQHGVHGDRESGAARATSRRLISVAIASIRPGKFQKRETIDPEKYQQLKDQIAELGFNFIVILFPDPDDTDWYNPAMGGHIRIQAAQELGITEVYAIVRDYDPIALAKGTYMENQARQPLTLVEEGLTFQQCADDLGWTQDEIAKNLIVPGGRSHVATCMLVASAAPDLREMLRREPTRGQRAFYYFRQLDDLGQERATELRAPHIESFLLGKISTDDVRLIMLKILAAERGEEMEEVSVELTKREQKIHSTISSFQRFTRAIGEEKPSEQERESLQQLRAKIDELLQRE